ncbi:MAG: CHC2 zinc finger domain-containing protein, partial [Thermodesulfovibrionales bacterium]
MSDVMETVWRLLDEKMEELECLFRLEEVYKRKELPRVKKKIQEFKREIGDEFKSSRIAFLEQALKDTEKDLQEAYQDYKGSMDARRPYAERRLQLDRILSAEKAVCKLKAEIRMLTIPKSSRITAQMITLAKDRDIREFLEVVRGDMALCPFHEEQHPSLWVKGNWFYCFGCHASGDVIEFIM